MVAAICVGLIVAGAALLGFSGRDRQMRRWGSGLLASGFLLAAAFSSIG